MLLRLTSIWWSCTHVIGIGIATHLWRRERHASYVWFGVSWLAMAVAGFTVGRPSLAAQVVTIAIRIIASTTGLIALWTLSRLARSRMITIYTLKNGDIVGRAHHEIQIEHDTIPPPPP